MQTNKIIESIEQYEKCPVIRKQWYNSDNMVISFDHKGETVTFELEQCFLNGCMFFIKSDSLHRETGKYTSQSYEKVRSDVFKRVKKYIEAKYFTDM